jgi:hypothetical protein
LPRSVGSSENWGAGLSTARGIALPAALAAVAVGAGFLVGYPAEVAAASAVAFAAVVALVTTRDLAARARSQARPVRRDADPPRLEQLRRIGEALAAAQASELGIERELRPLVRPLAAMRLARRGVDLDRRPEDARALLGEQLWELVRADRARGSNRVEGGISVAALESVIERLERI